MNKIFRVIWNTSLQCYVVASELAKGKVKSQSSAKGHSFSDFSFIVMTGLAIAVAIALMPVGVQAAGNVVADGVTVTLDGEDVVTSGSNMAAVGLHAVNTDGVLNFSNGSVTTVAASGHGAYALTNGLISLDNTSINTSGKSAFGIYTLNGGTINADAVEVHTTGASVYGVYANTGNVSLKNSDILVEGANSIGVATNGGNITITDSQIATTTTSGKSAYGIYTMNEGTINADGVEVHTAGDSAYGAYANTGSMSLKNSVIIVDGANSIGVATNGGNITIADSQIATTKDNSNGVYAGLAGNISLADTAITTAGVGSNGIYTRAGSTVQGDKLNITTTGKSAYALFADAGGVIDITNSVLNATSAYGVVAKGTGAELKLSNSSVNTTGDGSHGSYALNGAVMTLNNSTVTSNGLRAHAVFAANGSSMTINDSDIRAEGRLSYGAYATGKGSQIDINNSTITTLGTSSEAVLADSGAIINVANSDIYTRYLNSYGLRAIGSGTVNYENGTITTLGNVPSIQAMTNSTINVRNAVVNSSYIGIGGLPGTTVSADNLIINNDGVSKSDGIAAGLSFRGNNSTLALTNSQVNMNSDSSRGLQVREGAVATLDNVEFNYTQNGIAIAALENGTVNGTNVRINMPEYDQGGMSYGIWLGRASGDNQVNLDSSQIVLQGKNSAGMLFQTDDAGDNTTSLTNSLVSAEKGTAIIVAGNSNNFVTTSGTTLTGKNLLDAGRNSAGSVSHIVITGDNGSVFNGDVAVDHSGTDTNIINLINNSVWNGATTTLDNLNISSGGQWNVTSDSSVANLTLNNATLNMATADNSFNKVTLGTLNSDNGMLQFKTALTDDSSETNHLLITGDYSGNSHIVVQNAGGTGAQTLNGIELIRVDGNVNGTFSQQGRIVAGAYDYNLVQDANKWLLESNVNSLPPSDDSQVGTGRPADDSQDGTGSPADDSQNGTGSPADDSQEDASETGAPVGSGKVTSITRPEAGSYVANLAAANTLFSTTLHDRLGETHYIDADGRPQVTSLWLRNAGGHTRFNDSTGQLKTTGNRYVMQIGGDIAQWSSTGSDRFHLGVMGGYANAQNTTRSGLTGYSAKGQVHGYSTGLYATWLQDNEDKTGAYFDSWALYNWFDNSVKGEGIDEESYKSKGLTAAVEGGYTFRVSDISPRQSFFLQPKAQVNLMGVKSDDHTERNGTRIVGEGDKNVQTRLGLRAFIKGNNTMDDGKQRTFEPFIEAGWIHNTEAFGSRMNGVGITQAGSRNFAEVKVGLDAKINKTVNLWGNIGQQAGGKSYSDTSAMLGVKVNF